MKHTLDPRRLISFLALLTVSVIFLTSMWKSTSSRSSSGWKSNLGLSRFGKTGKEAGNKSEQVVLGDGGNGTVGMGEGDKEKGLEIPDGKVGGKPGRGRPKIVTAHFMLGNTYPYTPSDWHQTLDLAHQTGLDALTLNLGPEGWQADQARVAYRLAEEKIRLRDQDRGHNQGRDRDQDQGRIASTARDGLKLFLSLDMNVLPSSTVEEMDRLVNLVVELGSSAAQLRMFDPENDEEDGHQAERRSKKEKGKMVLSTFGGEDCSFGGVGWEGFLKACRERGTEIYFIPAFFLPPEKILGMDYLDGVFNWNAAWPMGNYTTSSIEDRPFLKSDKAYMAAVSPWFFTHYGKTGDWAWNKNWIYRSDDHLYATRWMNILEADFDPEFIQIISWNDYGESHYIGPILGAQPGSERWTDGMSHEAWRRLTEFFIRRYKGVPLSLETETRVYLSYRLQPRDCHVEGDPVGRPDRADFAQDVISVTLTVPEHMENTSRLVLAMEAGRDNRQEIVLRPKRGIAMALVPFVSGNVSFRLQADGEELLTGHGEPIAYNDKTASLYNFNAWTGSWSTQ